MQAVLSFDQAPPFAAPFRFFVTAPFFLVLAGLLLAVAGPDTLASRWTPGALALTHLVAVGFMLQVMIGALIQILPVVAGANMRCPLAVARIVHPLLSLGTLALAGAFLGLVPGGYVAAMLLLGAGVGLFLLAAGDALRKVPATSVSIGGFRWALLGLCGVLALGLLLAGMLGGHWSVPAVETTWLHANWGLAAWGLGLLSSVAYVVVPMFQITPPYPGWFSRHFGRLLLLAVVLLSLAVPLAGPDLSGLLQTAIVAMAAGFCGSTLWLQSRSKRTRPDTTQKFWRFAMHCGLAAALVWSVARLVPAFGEWERWAILFGVLVLFGGFTSVIVGMLYKIVPFLVWLHLQNRGQGRVMAPNMKAVLAEARMLRHFRVHLLAAALLASAALWPEWLARLAGLGLAASGALLAHNLLSAAAVFRRQVVLIDRTLAESSGGGE